MRKIIIIGAATGLAAALIAGCSSRKSNIKTQREAVTITETASSFKSNLEMNTSFYGDVLTGVFEADTNEVDSTTFESNGVKLKLKTTKGKNGKTKIDFKAEAKPVARSELRYEDKQQQKINKVDALKVDQQIKTVETRPYWLTGLYLIVTIIVLFLIIWAYKKYRSW